MSNGSRAAYLYRYARAASSTSRCAAAAVSFCTRLRWGTFTVDFQERERERAFPGLQFSSLFGRLGVYMRFGILGHRFCVYSCDEWGKGTRRYKFFFPRIKIDIFYLIE